MITSYASYEEGYRVGYAKGREKAEQEFYPRDFSPREMQIILSFARAINSISEGRPKPRKVKKP